MDDRYVSIIFHRRAAYLAGSDKRAWNVSPDERSLPADSADRNFVNDNFVSSSK